MEVEFQSKHPYSTNWLEVQFLYPNEFGRFERLKSALAAVLWMEDDRFLPPAPLNDVHIRWFGRGGTGLFGGWSETEKGIYMREARQVLTANGFKAGKVRRLTLQDLL